MLEALLMIIISLPIVIIVGFFYRKSNKYKEELHVEELKKKDEQENKNLEDFINLLEEKEKNNE